jgi:hypothetical protein
LGAHAPLTITISLPSGSATRQQSCVSSRSRATGRGEARLREVHAYDRYNFNPGATDIVTGKPDDATGRFAVIGWAKILNISGQLVKDVTWTMANPSSVSVNDPSRNR